MPNPEIPASDRPQIDQLEVFDPHLLRLRRSRAATNFARHDFLVREVGDRLVDRLADISRTFTCALDLGCHGLSLFDGTAPALADASIVRTDASAAMLNRLHAGGLRVVADEAMPPFADGAFDLIVSNMALHWVNDLPGALIQLRRMLRPDGLLLAALAGGATLHELRACLVAAEAETRGGARMRVSPFADLRDLGGLMQRAGFALPVVDSEEITVTYADPIALMRDLRGMGQTNAMAARPRTPLTRATVQRAAELYAQEFAQPDGTIPATFEVMFLHGWAPAPSQQQPLRPGSARTRLADALDTDERPAGEKAGPKMR